VREQKFFDFVNEIVLFVAPRLHQTARCTLASFHVSFLLHVELQNIVKLRIVLFNLIESYYSLHFKQVFIKLIFANQILYHN
jgi:hypothetical protein